MTSYVAGLNPFDLETVDSPEMPQTRPDMAVTSVPAHISITSSRHTCVLPIVAQARQSRRPARHRASKRGDRRLPHHSSSQNLPNRRVNNSVALRPGGNACRRRTSGEADTLQRGGMRHWDQDSNQNSVSKEVAFCGAMADDWEEIR
jgi:hypothetical protein